MTSSTTFSPASRWPRSKVHFVLLMALCAWLFTIHLGEIPFLGKDEPKNAEATREMMVRGDWVTTTLFEEPWFDKPILYYWISLVFFHLLGPGELAARLCSALFATGTVALTWWWTRRLFDAPTALRSGIVLATGLEFFWYARTAVVDLPLTFFVSLAAVAFYLALEGGPAATRWYLAAFAAMGGATLSKGPVGIILPALILGGYLLLSGRVTEIFRMPWLRGLLCFLLAAAPWYVVVTVRHGRMFWEDFILNRNIDRYLTTVHNHPGPFYYYLPVLILGIFPWGALIPFALVKIFQSGWRDLSSGRRAFAYLLLWVGLPLIFFSFAGSKLPSYLLPSFPALSILVAWAWNPVLESDRGPKWLRRSATGFLCISLAVLIAGIYLWCRREAPAQLPDQIPLMAVLAATGIAVVLAGLLRKRHLLFRLCATGTVIGLTLLIFSSLRNVAETGSLVRISRASVRLIREGLPVVAYRNFHNGLFFYTENLVPYVKDREELDRLLREHQTLGCLVESRGWKELRADSRLDLEILDRQRKVILARVRGPGQEGWKGP